MPKEPGSENTTYHAVGGHGGVVQLVDDFYDAMEKLPKAQKIRAMHKPGLTESRDKLVYFLSGWMGGPRIYGEKYGDINIPMAHQHIRIDADDRDAWLLCMKDALSKQNYPESLQTYLLDNLAFPANKIHQVSQMKHGHTT